MKRNAIALVVILPLVAFLSTVPVPSVVAQDAPSARIVLPTDRTVLPIPRTAEKGICCRVTPGRT